MYVIEIPTNKPCIREDMADLMFATEKGKYNAIVNFIKEVHAKGQLNPSRYYLSRIKRTPK